MDHDSLLMGSESLTREERELREELIAWCGQKLSEGKRPIPLQVALRVAADVMNDPEAHGLERNVPASERRLADDNAEERRSRFQIVDDAERPEDEPSN